MIKDITEPVVQLLGIGLTVSGSSVLSADSVLVADAAVISGPVYMDADLDLVADVSSITVFVEANLSSNTDLNSTSLIVVQAAAAMSSEVSLTVTETIVNAAASIVVGSSNLTAAIWLTLFQTSDIVGESDLSSSAILANITTARPLSGQSSLVATMFEPLNILVLPTVEYNYSDDRLMKFYGIDSGQSLIITGTTGRIVEFQTGTEIEATDYYFGGGRRHVLDDTEVTAVTNAGFGNLITIEGVPSGV